ncbi:MAG: penicillin-binding protein 2 [Elusimicrobia bacterium]|nr:penicillin-binding protein 2 [Elusimicrobiota bacterium]
MDLRARLAWAAAMSLTPLLPLSARLVYLQVLQHQDLLTRVSDEVERTSREAPQRGDILDRGGRVLAQSVPAWSCYVDKPVVREPQLLARRLERELGIPAEHILQGLKGPGRFLRLTDDLAIEDADRVAEARLQGVGIAAGYKRVYPNDGLGRGVIGTVSRDGRGLSGIELAFDRELTRDPAPREILRDGTGRRIYRAGVVDSARPAPLRLTLDRNYQFYAEEALAEAVGKYSAANGLVLVQDPADGELLAIAAYPPTALRNAAVQDAYEPGSTFKIVAAAAAVGESVVSADETFFCENGSWELAPGVTIKDHEPAGHLNLAGIIEHSSNIGTAKVAERVGALRFYRYCQAFGFLNRTGIGLPGETAGVFKPLSDMTRVSLLSASYGYGVAVSPLQLIGAYGAVANGGTLYEPSIVLSGRDPVRVRRVASQESVRKLTAFLEGVVERGTGVTAQIQGYRVAGKTGTARKLDPVTKRYSAVKFVASFVGFVPVSRPRFAILVLLDDPKGSAYYGSQVAAPVFAKLARGLLTLEGIPPDRPGAVEAVLRSPGAGALKEGARAPREAARLARAF